MDESFLGRKHGQIESGVTLQNEFDNSGIKGIEEQDLGQVEVTPNEQETSAFPQFTDAAKQQRGIEDFKSLKKRYKENSPLHP